MKDEIFNGSLEAHLRNQRRPGLDPNKPVINKPEPEEGDHPTKEQKKAEALLGKLNLQPVVEVREIFVSAPVPAEVPHKDVEGCDYTINYDQFKHLATNRPVDRAHVVQLVKRITKKNLLHLNPILVNREMEIIDGQHRLEAAKFLKLPIYFTVDGSVSQDDIADMNSAKKNWQLADYLNFYANKGVHEYLKFKNLCDRYRDYNASMLMAICSSTGKRGSKDVIAGILDIGNISNADNILSKIDFFKKHFHLAGSSRFIEAFLFILHSKEEYDHERMVQKVELSPFLLIPCADKNGYIKMLQSIYNRGVREENIVLFLKR
ncbi:MAG: ParB N-terminal domain-containing protein [Taibaiella sp.]|jgi:hypothetical protein